MGTIPEGTPEDVDRAARAAADAFVTWSTTSREERAKTLERVQEALTARTQDIATLISQEVGMPFTLSNLVQVGLPVMSFAAAAAARHRVPLRGGGRQLPHRPRARRRRGRHHAVELPVAPDRGQGRTGSRRGVHGRAQAERGGAAQRLHPGRDPRRHRLAPGGLQPRDRCRSRRGRGHRLPPPRRHGVVHGVDACGQAGDAVGVRRRQARRPGARRQVAERDPRGRRSLRGGAGGRGRLLHQLGADLLCAHAHAGPSVTPRRGRGARRAGSREIQAGRPLRR